jgi:two-component system, chemotaxis family, chemotaxis protein CheY
MLDAGGPDVGPVDGWWSQSVGDVGTGQATGGRAAARGAAPVVLVVEDDAATRALLRDVLEDAGYAVRVAADGAAGLRAARAVRPALVLLDLRLPGTDGWAFAAAYRRAPAPRAPVVVLTADVDAAAYAAGLGAAGHLLKPFDLDELLALVRRLTAGPPGWPRGGA